jgi:hypothetical protein
MGRAEMTDIAPEGTPIVVAAPPTTVADVTSVALKGHTVPVKSAVVFGALCYFGGIIVGVKAAQLIKAPCQCEEEVETVTVIDVTAVPVVPDDVPEPEPVGSDSNAD